MATDYIDLTDSAVAIKKPCSSTIVRALRDNPIAIAEGNVDAPKIWAQALRYVDFTSTGTFSVPDGCTKVFVELVGGGGGGACGVTSGIIGGGSAGGQAKGWVTVTPGDNIAVTIGAGGVGGNTGNAVPPTAGGTTSFGSYISATGGSAGFFLSTDYTGQTTNQLAGSLALQAYTTRGGVGASGDWNYQGSSGGVINNGSGHPSQIGGGGVGIGAIGGNWSALDATVYGGGGPSGAWGSSGNTGKNGKSGFVRVWY